MSDKLSWEEVENAINKEILWLKDSITSRGNKSILSDFDLNSNNKCDCCEYTYRKLALLIISGQIKAREIKVNNFDDYWNIKSNSKIITHYHGKEWHNKTMSIIERYFKDLGYDITVEPYLNGGRADLGVFMDNKKDLYVEIGTVSLNKLWVNLSTMKNVIFLVVPSEDKVIEFET